MRKEDRALSARLGNVFWLFVAVGLIWTWRIIQFYKEINERINKSIRGKDEEMLSQKRDKVKKRYLYILPRCEEMRQEAQYVLWEETDRKNKKTKKKKVRKL